MASYAVMNGVPVPVASRLLGHSKVGMTLCYAHLADRDIEAAAERVGAAIARAMALASPRSNPTMVFGGQIRVTDGNRALAR